MNAIPGPIRDHHALASEIAHLRRVFELDSIESESLTRFAVVHRARTADGTAVVVKMTASAADAMARWTRGLAAEGIDVVTPVAGPHEHEGSNWVVYPFIGGDGYSGSTAQIRAAGALLGRLHAAPVPVEGLRKYTHPDTTREEVDDDLVTLRRVFEIHLEPGAADTAHRIASSLGKRWWHDSWPVLVTRDAELPRTGVSSDYKAANLVFREGLPVLVDPDNAGVEPRLYDLAMTLLLFHCECPGAPARMLSPEEWSVFVGAYLEHVELTAAEQELWPAAVDHMWWEEGTWLLEDNDERAWEDPVQGGYLRSLARWDPTGYTVSPMAR